MANLFWTCLVLFLAIEVSSKSSLDVKEMIPLQEEAVTSIPKTVNSVPEAVNPVPEVNTLVLEDILSADPDETLDVKQQDTDIDMWSDIGNALARSGFFRSNQKNIAPRIGKIMEYIYKSCKSKIIESGLLLTRLSGGYYYFSMDLQLNWVEAAQWCLKKNMLLASLETEEENAAVSNYLLKLSSAPEGANFLIGGVVTVDNPYAWLSGNKFEFTNWGAGQPLGLGTLGACLQTIKLGGTVKWSDILCNTKAKFICELYNPCSNVINMARGTKNVNPNIIHRK